MKNLFVLAALAALSIPSAANAAFMHFVCKAPDKSAYIEFKPVSTGTIEITVYVARENYHNKSTFKTTSCETSDRDLRIIKCNEGGQELSSEKITRLGTRSESSRIHFAGSFSKEQVTFDEANCGPEYPDPEK